MKKTLEYYMNSKKWLIPSVLILGIVLSMLCSASAETLKVIKYQGEFPPYFYQKDGKEIGGFIDLISRLSKLTGYQFKFISLPVSRALHLFNLGKVDIEVNINPAWRTHLKEPGLFTIPYDQSTEIVMFSPGGRIPVKKPIDLKGQHIGVVFGYRYPAYDKLFKEKVIFRHDFKNEQKLLKILQAGGGIKQIFINKYAALYWKKTIPSYHNFEPGDEISQLDVMLRVHPSKKYIIPHLNMALRYMIKRGEIKKIYSNYR